MYFKLNCINFTVLILQRNLNNHGQEAIQK